ncbi:MAG: hypothetical protein KDB07_06095, partial [Planctomycetes bacterium]|nr:hypothetical protein [Planctomycetota bacterium]
MAGPLKLREDLIAIRKVRHGEVEYVVKDPIHMEYYRLTELEYDVAMLFDGHRSNEQVLKLVN